LGEGRGSWTEKSAVEFKKRKKTRRRDPKTSAQNKSPNFWTESKTLLLTAGRRGGCRSFNRAEYTSLPRQNERKRNKACLRKKKARTPGTAEGEGHRSLS